MSVRVINRSRSLVTVPLNSGESLHLAPGESSRALDDVEIHHNPWVAALVQRQWVAVSPLGAEREASAQD